MIGPTFLAMFALLIELSSTKKSENPKKFIRFLKCLLHLPILQTVQTFIFFKKMLLVAKDKEETANFAVRIDKWIDDCGSFRLDEEWTWAKIKQSFKGRVSKEDKKLLKDLFKKNYQDCCNGQASAKLKALTAAYQMEKEDNLAKVKSEIQEFKIYEAFGESAPQFILQACAILHKNPTLSIGMTSNNSFLMLPFDFCVKIHYYFSGLGTLEYLTLSSSFISVIYTVTTTFLKMPFIIDGKKEAPYMCSKNYLIVAPLMLAIVTPRLLALTVLFASFRGIFCIGILITCLILYGAIFWTTFYFKILAEKGIDSTSQPEYINTMEKATKDDEKFWKWVFISFFTSIIGPCVSIDPRSALIFASSSISVIAQVTLMASLQIVAFFDKNLLAEEFAKRIQDFQIFYWCLIPTVILTSLGSYFLLEEKRQVISLKFGFGPICCDEKNQFHWACNREYLTLINYYLDSPKMVEVLNETDVNGYNGFVFSYRNQKLKALEALLQHSKKHFDTKSVRSTFWDSCYHGNIKVVELFSKHPQKDRIFNEKDYEGSGNIFL